MLRAIALHVTPIFALLALVGAMGGTWLVSSDAVAAPASPPAAAPPAHAAARAQSGVDPPAHATRTKSGRKQLTGKLNLNTATEDQLLLLPTVGPAKAERIVEWRKHNGGFKRTADLRRVKGFGYRTFKRLEPFLDVKGETTLAAAP
ncbi:MAG TPA: helix-hairpin-helix domain-containing protein [Kofleriaceae bacterium]